MVSVVDRERWRVNGTGGTTIPMRDPYDRSTKWLIAHQGAALLHLGGATGFTSCRPVQSEVVAPKKLPDGLLEVAFPGESDSDLYVVEISTYPERRAEQQARDDALLVLLDRGRLPEVLTLVLQPRGPLRIEGREEIASRRGWSRLGFNWRVVELWTLSAEELLSANEVGLIPWVPLAQSGRPAEVVLQECRDRIDRLVPPAEQGNFLAVTQMLARLRYNRETIEAIFRRSGVMIESPWLKEIMDERETEIGRRYVVDALTSRFSSVPEEVRTGLLKIIDPDRLLELHAWAARCPDLNAFRARLET
jgi:hypothetical protein